LAVGTPLEIPLIAFVRTEAEPAKGDAKVQAAVLAPPQPPAPEASPAAAAPPAPADDRRFASQLAAAGRSFADGEYDGARETLEALRERVLGEGAVSDRREWGQLMAFVYIALDRDDDACTAYRSGSPPAGPTNFDPDLISPRIRSVLSNCPAADLGARRLDNPAAAPQISPHAGTQR
jgi:hypothetical protein